MRDIRRHKSWPWLIGLGFEPIRIQGVDGARYSVGAMHESGISITPSIMGKWIVFLFDRKMEALGLDMAEYSSSEFCSASRIDETLVRLLAGEKR